MTTTNQTAATVVPPAGTPARVPWNPWLGVLFVLFIYFASQAVSGLALSIYPAIHHWTQAQATDWINNSVLAQFVYILLAEALTIGAIYGFLRACKADWRTIALRRPR